MRRKLPYTEGTWFAVPLKNGGYGVGVAARIDGTGGVLGYLFGPVRDEVPQLDEVLDCEPGDAVYVGHFGDLGLLEGLWPVIGQDPEWDRSHWPLPRFYRQSIISGQTWRVEYDDQLTRLREIAIEPGAVKGLVHDGMAGEEYVRIRLTMALTGETGIPPTAEAE